MSRNRKLQSFLVLFALVANIVATALPASAALLAGTASVLTNDGKNYVFSGTQATLIFSVTNGGSAPTGPAGLLGPGTGGAANWVRIGPKVTGGTFTPSGASTALPGFTSNANLNDLDGDGIMDAATFKGGSLAAGATGSFTVVADAASIPADSSIPWVVELSDNNGQNVKKAATNPLINIRVLSLETVQISGPAGALDRTATAGQPNLTYDTTVHNYASIPLTIDPALSSSNGSDTVTDVAATAVPVGQSATFRFPVALTDAAGNRTFTGSATANGASAPSLLSDALTVQAKPAFTFATGSLQPVAGISGSSQAFSLTVAKTGPPSVAFAAAETTLSFNGPVPFGPATLAGPSGTGANADTKTLSFNPLTIPGSPALRDADGDYTGTLVIRGTDNNDAPFAQTVSITDLFTIDNLMPNVVPSITAPGSQADFNGTPTAKSTQTLTIGGTIRQGAAETAPLDPTATVTDCQLVITPVDSTIAASTTPVALASCRNSGNGNLTGSVVVPALPGSLQMGHAFIEVKVADIAGNATPGFVRSASFVLIDNKAPTFSGGLTGCAPGSLPTCVDTQTIRLILAEPVKGTFGQTDFRMSGNVVTRATCNTTKAGWCQSVTLEVAQAFGRDAGHTVNYAVTAPLGTRPTDGATNSLGDSAIQIIDGIVPDLPTLATVTQDNFNASGGSVSTPTGQQGSTADDTGFYTNQQAPTFAVGNLQTSYTAIVAADQNTNNLLDPADLVIAECISEGAQVNCATGADVLLNDGTYTLLVAARDAGGNLSKGTGGNALVAKLFVDQVAPTSTGFTVGVAGPSASFTEILGAGREFAADWIVREALADGKFRRFTVGSVGGSGASRDLTMDDTDYNTTLADQVLYTLQGTPDERYRDRAGNILGNFILSAP